MRETVWQLVARLCPDGVPYRKLGEVCEFPTERISMSNAKCYVGVENLVKDRGGANVSYDFPKADTAIAFKSGDVLIGNIRPYLRKIWLADSEGGTNGDVILIRVASESLNARYLYYNLSSESFFYFLNNGARGGKMPRGDKKTVPTYPIPIPPPEVQREVVRILDKFSAKTATLVSLLGEELAARRKQYAYYRDCLLSFDGGTRGGSGGARLPPAIALMVARACPDGVEYRMLGEIGRVCMCKRIMKAETSSEGDVPFYKIGTFGGTADAYISRETFEKYKAAYPYPKKGDILISAAGTIGKTVIFDGEPAYFQDSNIVWVDNDESLVLNKYLFYCYQQQPWAVSKGGTIARIYNDNVSNAKIPLPPLEVQREVARILDEFSALTTSLTTGLPAEIAARQKQYEYWRDKLLAFKRKG